MSFRFGKMAREGVVSRTCFDAVVKGERTGTTRFPQDGASQYAKWVLARPGDIIRIWSDAAQDGIFRGKSCLIEIVDEPRVIQLSTANRSEWSKVEGWCEDYIDVLVSRGRDSGIQVFYRLHTPPFVPQAEFGW